MVHRLKNFFGHGTGEESSSLEPEIPPSPTEGMTTLDSVTAQPRPGDIGRFRRERHRLLKVRERSIRDLGGLALEMVKRDEFKPDLIRRRARDILGLEAAAHDVEDALAAAENSIPSPSIGVSGTSRCACGASNGFASTFCADCGRSIGSPTDAAHRCTHCSTALPGDARFCPTCGTNAEAARESTTGAGW
jgi:hypothetical protein